LLLITTARAARRHAGESCVRRVFIVYLVFYYLLVAGAGMTVWRSGLITHLDRTWTFLVIGIAVALGVLLIVVSRD
jgi:hypothetical protein